MMESEKDIRWEQRLSNFNKALGKLEESVRYIQDSPMEAENLDDADGHDDTLSELVKQGLIQSFEYTHELAWNVMKDFALYQGNVEIRGSRDATREAFSMGLISNGDAWMEMIKSRNKTSHTYNEETANEIFHKILTEYFPAFAQFRSKMEEIRTGSQGELFHQQ